MIYPAPDKLDSMGSKYALVIVAAKRARQIKEGARRLVDSRSANSLTVALEELAAGALIPLQVGEPEPLPSSLPPTPVLTGLVATSIEDEVDREPTAAEIGAMLAIEDDVEEEDGMHALDDEIGASDAAVLEDDLDAEEDGDHFALGGEEADFEEEADPDEFFGDSIDTEEE
jgi:DNA-directed RNA polymerase subunit omega